MNIIGQDKLINKINSTNIDDWPSSTILLGDVGCGKHTVLNYITNRYNLKQIELTKNLNQESIEAAYQRVEPCLYYFDAKLLSEKQQNMLLKFIEEPLSGSFIVILCDNRSRLLPTVLNITSDFSIYIENRDLLVRILSKTGYEIACKPEGAFYLFIKSLEDDAIAFCKKATEFNLFMVPSDSFGLKGYVRISYCVSSETIKNSEEAFKKLKEYYERSR